MAPEPKTLQEAIIYFADPNNCLSYIAARRWKNGVTCPTCGSKNVGFVASRKVWQCKTRHAKSQFTVKVGTVMEDSPIGLDKWLTVMWMVANCKNGISSWEIHRSLGVTQKTAWFLLHRVRLAMQSKNAGKLGGGSGQIEADESYIGGKARNMHKDRKARVLQGKGGGSAGKVGVQGILERGGEVRLNVIRDSKLTTLVPHIEKNVESGAHLFTDEAVAYFGLQAEYVHDVINHAEAYAIGEVHTNGLENF
jgi:transposase-like protein